MTQYDAHNTDFDRRQAQRQAQREARRASRSRRKPTRSVGADVITPSAARSIGLAHPSTSRNYGRGETARRVGDWGRGAADPRQPVGEARRRPGDLGRESDAVAARPAVYTQEPEQKRFRLRLPSLPSIGAGVDSVPLPLVAVVLVAIALAIVWGPVRTYYSAWRQAGALQAQYEIVAAQNGELGHELDRLQTIEGVEDEARRRGYAYPDEEALVIDGVEDARVADPAAVARRLEEYEAGQPWYIHLLDGVFGYSASAGR